MCGKLFFIISLFLVLGLATGAAHADLVAWYEFEGNADDSADSNHGSLMGDATFGTGPTYGGVDFGQALSLDGDGDYVSLPTAFASVTGSTTKTITAWAKSNTIDYSASGGMILELYRKSDSSSGFYIRAKGNPATWEGFYMTGTATWDYIDSGVSVALNGWAHVALVQDETNVRIYVNGNLANSVSDAGAPYMSNPNNATIGAYVFGTAVGFFNGLIDDVRIYNHALSQGEIQAIIPEPATLLLLGLGGLMLRRK